MRTVTTLGVFPAYRDNPYVNLMTLAPRAAGVRVDETATLEGAEVVLAGLARGDAFHLHWTSPIAQRAVDGREEARVRSERFVAALRRARERGVLLVWTIHNVVPHDARHLDVEVALCQALADLVDVVHAMSTGTVDAAREHYVVDPAKVVTIPHPSYQGVYSSTLSRREARERLGLDADDHAVLFFGQMRSYKGLDVLLSALGRVARDTGHDVVRPVVLLAGKTSADELAFVEEHLPTGLRAVRHHDRVDDADVETWFAAADVAVLPYRRILNSGTVHLAATFGLPVVLPREDHLVADFGGESWVGFYGLDDPVGSLASLLSQPATYSMPRDGARDFSHRLSPFTVSNRYADLLSERLAGLGAGLDGDRPQGPTHGPTASRLGT